jgi:hypothetical protein
MRLIVKRSRIIGYSKPFRFRSDVKKTFCAQEERIALRKPPYATAKSDRLGKVASTIVRCKAIVSTTSFEVEAFDNRNCLESTSPCRSRLRRLSSTGAGQAG